MQEIEVKARLREKDAVVKQLLARGCVLSDVLQQHDVVYTEKVGSLEIFLSNKVFLRIRVNNDKEIIFTVKQRTGALVAIEHEVHVDSKEELEKMLAQMGYQRAMEIKKKRQITHYNGDEICIDDVEGLGTFIEMERLTESGDAKHIQDELFNFFVSLGISPEDRVTKGYDLLMFEKS